MGIISKIIPVFKEIMKIGIGKETITKADGSEVEYTLVNAATLGGAQVFNSVADLLKADKDFLDSKTVMLLGYHYPGDGGGGIFVYDSSMGKWKHNGGTIIDDTKEFPLVWTDPDQQYDWFFKTNTGLGAWVRLYTQEVTSKMFGSKEDSPLYDKYALEMVDKYKLLDYEKYGGISITGHIQEGRGSGGVGLTHNDGYGNANITFNHFKGYFEQSGNAGRITVNTDDDGDAEMAFLLKSSVEEGVRDKLNLYLSIKEYRTLIKGTLYLQAPEEGKDTLIYFLNTNGVAKSMIFRDDSDNDDIVLAYREDNGIVHRGLILSYIREATYLNYKKLSMTHPSPVFVLDTSYRDPLGDGFKRITCNDGGGNFNIRAGHYYDTTDKVDKYIGPNGATHILLTQDGVDGKITLRVGTKGEDGGIVNWSNNFVVHVDGECYIRGYKVWHTGNDGADSGLNADMVDGLHANQFVRSDANDTMYGQLKIDSARNNTNIIELLANQINLWANYYKQDSTSNRLILNMYDDGSAGELFYSDKDRNKLSTLTFLNGYIQSENDFKVNGKLTVSGDVETNGGVIATKAIITTSHIQEGLGNGGVALTHNDGYGNANVTFNHLAGKPEQDGNAARITVNTDSTVDPYFSFQLGENVQKDVAISLKEIVKAMLDVVYVKTILTVRPKSSDENSIVRLEDENGNHKGSFYWNRDDDTVQISSSRAGTYRRILTAYADENTTIFHTKHIVLEDGRCGLHMDTNYTDPEGMGFKKFTCNDGGGNFNIRTGHYYDTGDADEKYIGPNGAVHMLFTQDGVDGKLTIRVAPKGEDGQVVDWTNTFEVRPDGECYIRGYKIWHKGDDGAGSGLDADMVDGLHAGQFVRSDADDTKYGVLTIDANNDGDRIIRLIENRIDLWANYSKQDETSNRLTMNMYDDGSAGEVKLIDKDGNPYSRLILKNGLIESESNFLNNKWSIFGSKSRLEDTDTNGQASLEFYGDTSSGIFVTQDGNGRMTLKWNATRGTGETFLVADEYAGRWEFNPSLPGDEMLKISVSDTTGNAGDSITWKEVLAVGTTVFRYLGNTIWHSGNDGSGSGLDADKLDGLDSSQFVRSDVSDTLNGDYTVNGDIINNGELTTNKFYVKAASSANDMNIFFVDENNNKKYINYYNRDNSTVRIGLYTDDGSLKIASSRFLDNDDYPILYDYSKHIYFTNYLHLTAGGAALFFDSENAPDGNGFKRITCNDGGGNWNFRAGCYYSGGDKYTTDGDGAAAIVQNFEGQNGNITLKVAEKGTAGDAISWITTFTVATTGVFINGGRVWHSNNDGSGSGLDADKLDGLDSSQFLRSDTDDSTSGDLEFTDAAKGVILKDRSTGALYRLGIDNGQLIIEEV